MNDSIPSRSWRASKPYTSSAFRILAAVATGLLTLLWTTTLDAVGFEDAVPWAAALLTGGLVFAFADTVLAVLVVAIPPGLFVLWLAGLLSH